MRATMSSRRFHRVVLPLALLTGCAAVRSAEAATPVWSTHGPYGGITSVLVVDPKVPSTIYEASPGGGVFKSLNAGARWAPASGGLTDPTCFTLAIDPVNHDILYTAGGNGIFKSTDGAAHWSKIAFRVNVRQLVIHPKVHTTLYAVISGSAVQKSVDGGATWVSQFNSLPSTEVNVLVIDPKAPSNLYAGAIGGLYRSTNGGASWILTTAGLGKGFIDVTNLFVDPLTPAVLFAQTALGVAKSTNHGVTWKPVTTPHGYFILQAIDPKQANTVYGATVALPPSTPGALYISRNAGATWSKLGALNTNFFGDVATLAIDPTKSANLYAGTEQGMFASANQGATWAQKNQGLANVFVTALALNSKSPGTLYAGTEASGIFKTLNGGLTWARQYNDWGGEVTSLQIDPVAPSTLYFADDFLDGVFKSQNAGATWSHVLGSHQFLSLAMDQTNPASLFAGSTDGVFASANAGKTWSKRSAGLPTDFFQPVSLSASGGTVIVSDPNNGAFVSMNHGVTWSANDPTAPAASRDSNSASTGASPAAAEKVESFAAGFDEGVHQGERLKAAFGLDSKGKLRSVGYTLVIRVITNADSSSDPWTLWAAPTGVDAANCPPITALVSDPKVPTTFYAGGLCGVLKGTNDGKQLIALGTGLPANVPVRGLAVAPSGKIVYAATYGRGVYSITTP